MQQKWEVSKHADGMVAGYPDWHRNWLGADPYSGDSDVAQKHV